MAWFDPRCASSPSTGGFAGSTRLTALACCLLTGLGGCTIVQVRSPDGVRTTYYPGMAVIRVSPTDSVQVVEVESLGASSVADNATLGWNHSQIALVPPGRCQLILWRPRAAELKGLQTLAGPSSEICDGQGEVK